MWARRTPAGNTCSSARSMIAAKFSNATLRVFTTASCKRRALVGALLVARAHDRGVSEAAGAPEGGGVDG